MAFAAAIFSNSLVDLFFSFTYAHWDFLCVSAVLCSLELIYSVTYLNR